MTFLPVPFARNIDDVDLQPDDFAPGQILEGEPTMGSAVLWESPDGKTVRGVWEATPGTFSWEFDTDELFVVIRGRVEIQMEGAPPMTVGPGDFAVFKPGDRAVWRVTEAIRKVFQLSEV